MSDNVEALIAEARSGEPTDWRSLAWHLADALEAAERELALLRAHEDSCFELVHLHRAEKAEAKLADAWDEGFDVGYDRVLVERATALRAENLRHNPYRREQGDGRE